MKFGIYFLLFASIATQANPIYSEQLAQALLDQSLTIQKKLDGCAKGVGLVESQESSPMIYTHRISFRRLTRGPSGPNCHLTIVQDYTPNQYDGPVRYQITVIAEK